MINTSETFEAQLKENGLRFPTEKNLARLTKGIEKYGYAIIKPSGTGNPDVDRPKKDALRRSIGRNGLSYLTIYTLKEEDVQKDWYGVRDEMSFLVFPYDVCYHTEKEFHTFAQKMKDISENMQDCRLQISYSNADIDLLSIVREESNTVAREIVAKAEAEKTPSGEPAKPSPAVLCCIDCPPTSMMMSHSRYAARDINHIYKEDCPPCKR